MIYWIRKLQTQLGIKVTGIFDQATLDSVKYITRPTPPIIRLIQEFLNRLGNYQLEVNGKWDKDTKEMLTYFQKEYSYKLNKEMPITARLDEATWELIAEYCRSINNIIVLSERS